MNESKPLSTDQSENHSVEVVNNTTRQIGITKIFADESVLFLLCALVVLPLIIFPYASDQVFSAKIFTMKVAVLLAVGVTVVKALRKTTLSKPKDINYPDNVVQFPIKTCSNEIGENTSVSRSGTRLLAYLGAALVTLLAISTVLSQHRDTSLEGIYLRYDGFYSYLIYLSTFYFAMRISIDKKKLELLAKTGVVTAAIVSVYGVLQVFGFDPTPWGTITFDATRSFSSFGNPVMLAAYLCLMLPLSIALVINEKSSRRKALYVIPMFAIATCIGTSMTRAAWIAAGAGVLVQLVLLAKAGRLGRKGVIMIVSVLIMVVVAIISVTGIDGFSSRVTSVISADKSLSNRFDMWQLAARVIKDYPVFGVGPDAMAFIYPRYETMQMAQAMPFDSETNVHNIYLQLASTAGVPALIVFSAILLVVFIRAFKYYARFRSSADEDSRFNVLLLTGLISGVTAYLVQGVTGISGIETSTFMWLFLGVMAGYGALCSRQNEVAELRNETPRRQEVAELQGVAAEPVSSKIAKASLNQGASVVVSSETLLGTPLRAVPGASLKFALTCMIAVLVIAGIIGSTKMFVSDYFLGAARIAENNSNLDKAVEYYQKSAEFDGGSSKALMDLGLLLADEGRQANNKQEWLNGIECLKEAVSKNRNDYESLQYLGQGYLYGAKAFGKSNYIPAERNLGNATKLRPNAPLALAMLGVVYYDTGRLEKAGNVLAKAIYVNPKDPQAHYYYGLYFEKMGKRDSAKQQFAITLEIDSSHEKARVAYDNLTRQGF